MLEMKITVTAPDVVAALNNLANAIADGNAPKTVCNQHGESNTHIDNAGTVNVDAPVAPATPVAPPAQPAVNPTQAPGVPLSAMGAQTPAQYANVPVQPATTPVAPVVPTAPVAPAYTAPAPVAPAAPAVPTGAPAYTLEQIARAGTALVDAGKMDALIGLLGKYNVEALTALDPSQYGNFATDLRALGAQL